jgi:hypothetical protein
MKTINPTNATSTFTRFTSIFALFALLLLSFPGTLQAGHPAGQHLSLTTGSGLVIDLGETMSGSQIITVENLIGDQDSFSGTWWSANPAENMNQIIFNQTSGGSLPANSEVALLTVTDPVYGFTKSYVLGTDGGAILLVLGDF